MAAHRHGSLSCLQGHSTEFNAATLHQMLTVSIGDYMSCGHATSRPHIQNWRLRPPTSTGSGV
uniref:Uncharacterized protein n=1 Tax=Aegilops tauschii TaxID=37682 RepID=M8BKK3_AEGTA